MYEDFLLAQATKNFSYSAALFRYVLVKADSAGVLPEPYGL